MDLRLPPINGANDHEKLAQIQSYLYQLAEQLQITLDQINKEINEIKNKEGK